MTGKRQSINISIPYSSIKSCYFDAVFIGIQISIPYSSIKRKNYKEQMTDPRISIPYSSIKRMAGKITERKVNAFQFHIVRLKVKNW